MNFDLSEEQQVVNDLAATIFTAKATSERVKAIERGDDAGFDGDLWKELAAAGVLGLCLPEVAGGSGMGMVELALVAIQQGRCVAPVPLIETVVAAMTIARFGSTELRQRLLGGIAGGDVVATGALTNLGAATPTGGGFRLVGTHPIVPAARHADVILVPATLGDGSVAVLAVERGDDGMSIEPVTTTDLRPHANVIIDTTVPAGTRLGDGTTLAWIEQRQLVAQAAITLGVCERSLELTAEHVSTREQFGRPLATMQAVGQRAADCYITTEALRVTTLNAAWRLDQDLDSTAEALVAAWWAAEGGQQVVLAGQHLHGGIGADVDYPVHRYFLWATQLANTLGTGSSHLARLGAVIAGSAAR